MAQRKQHSKSAPRIARRGRTKGTLVRNKVSIAVGPQELAWAESEAKRRDIALSAVFADAIRLAQHDAAWERFVAATGGPVELSAEEEARIDAEFREMGIIT